MSRPKVSICMPTLNSEAYLAPRLESIRRQTMTDWELVVVDSQSDDQTLPMIESFAQQGGVVRVHQGPRDGIYTNINRSIEYAQGQYIYIATSDDTMADDCLEKLAGALDQYPSCGLAHCPLRLLDADGGDSRDNWWQTRSTFSRSAGDLIDRTHIRKAPYDGLLHTLGQTVYISLTQLLIRRDLFDRIGMFRSDWGSISDFYWDMRAALTTDTVHVGKTWASWRVHDTQATAGAQIGEDLHAEKIRSMIEHALDDSRSDLPSEAQASLQRWHEDAKRLSEFIDRMGSASGSHSRIAYLCKELLCGSGPAREYALGKILRRRPIAERAPKTIERWLTAVGMESIVQASRPPQS